MAETKGQKALSHRQLAKCPTGIQGLDEITGGGLPRGRPTLVCGGAGAGKTLLSIEFVVRGAVTYGEPGVFMSFEETSEELAKNVASLGFDLADLEKQKLLALDFVYVERREIEETGEYDLEGLFIRLGHAIDSVGAKRVVLDTVEALFAGFPNELILRAELAPPLPLAEGQGRHRLITGEQGEGTLTRHGLEEYVSDCVLLLDHRVVDQIATRRLRFVKYRGSLHGTDEYPFLIDESGFSVLPVTSLRLDYAVTSGARSPPASRAWMPCWAARAITGAAASWSPAPPARGKTSLAASLRRRRLPPGRALPLLAFRGIPEPGHPQHALHRPGPGALGQGRTAPIPCRSFHPLRPGDAPGHDPQADQ